MKPVKPKKCKNKDCGKMFTPSYSTTQPVCSPGCAHKLSKEKDAKVQQKKRNAETKAMREDLMTKGDWLNLAQITFNTYIRLRDKDRPCISCQVTKCEEFHAGHYIATTYSYLRFNEDNCWRQCSKCNTHLRGNSIPYRINLIQIIGLGRVEKLENDRHKKLEMSIPEIKELIVVYKDKIKQLKAA